MADAGVVAEVKRNIADDADGDGWNDTLIGSLLDSGTSVTKVTLAFWESRVAKLSTIVDVSESGSSRQLGTLFDKAKIARDMWLDKSKLEDNPEPERRYRAGFHSLKRV